MRISSGGISELAAKDGPASGRLYVPPSYHQVSGDLEARLDSADDWVAMRISPEVDFLIDALSLYITAVGTEGDITAEIYSDSTALEPNGALNPCEIDVAPIMTADDAPSPYVVSLVDKDGNSASFGGMTSAWVALNGNVSSNSCEGATRVTLDNAAVVNNGDGTVGLPCTGHAVIAGDCVWVQGSTNYNGEYVVDSVAANYINVTKTYVSETLSGAVFYIQPTANYPLFYCVDFGEGNALALNSFRMNSKYWRSAPDTFSFWGSNETAPTKQTETDYTQINKVGGTSWSGEAPTANYALKRFDATNATAYRHYKWKITDVSASNPYFKLGINLQFYATPSQAAPGSFLATLDAIGSGASADSWVRKALSTTYQCTRNRPVWLVLKGEAGKDFSLSARRANTDEGSSHPDGALCKVTADSGSSWTQSLQDDLPACLNVIVNSQANHCPQLYYGRRNGEHIYLPGSGLAEIPQAGVSLDCSALTADTEYYVYAYLDSGALALEASTTAPITYDGLLVKTGTTSRRWVGMIYPQEVHTGYQGPVSVSQLRLVWNLENRIEKILGKEPPYTSITYAAEDNDNEWHEAQDGVYRLKFICGAPTLIEVSGNVVVWGNGSVGLWMDGKPEGHAEDANYNGLYYPQLTPSRRFVAAPGFHYVSMYYRNTNTALSVAFQLHFFRETVTTSKASIGGKLMC